MHLFIEFCGENVSSETTNKICERLQKEKIEALCLRECTITDKNYKKVLKRVGHNYTLRHLSLCVDVVVDSFRVQTVAKAVQENLSLSGLYLHGSAIGNNGMKTLQESLLRHPGIVNLDLSDCQIGDDSIDYICQLLPGDKTRHGLRELVLSSNPEVSTNGWNKLSIALASSNHLTTLCVDYNHLGDSAAACLLAAVAGSITIETLDMECTGLTDVTGKLFLHLLQNQQMKLSEVNLNGNDICKETLEAIRHKLNGDDVTIAFELNLDNPSDDDGSLATSEPPLDDSNSLFVSSRRNSAVVNDGFNHSTARENVNLFKNVQEENTKMGYSLADTIKLSKNIVLDETCEIDFEPVTIRSRSMNDIRQEEESADIHTEMKSMVSTSCTRIEVTEQHDDNDGQKQRMEETKLRGNRTCNNLLTPETPSLVSLHTYGDSQPGQEDAEFEPIGKFFSRPSSAPIAKANRLTVQGIGSSPVKIKPYPKAVVSPSVQQSQRPMKTLSPHASIRRYSTGNTTLVSEVEDNNDTRASLKSLSVIHMSRSNLIGDDNDLNIEDL